MELGKLLALRIPTWKYLLGYILAILLCMPGYTANIMTVRGSGTLHVMGVSGLPNHNTLLMLNFENTTHDSSVYGRSPGTISVTPMFVAGPTGWGYAGDLNYARLIWDNPMYSALCTPNQTTEFWMYVTANSGIIPIITWKPNGDNSWGGSVQYNMGSGVWSDFLYKTSTYCSMGTMNVQNQIAPNTWYYVSVVVSGNKDIILHVNGQPIGACHITTQQTGVVDYVTGQTVLVLGQYWTGFYHADNKIIMDGFTITNGRKYTEGVAYSTPSQPLTPQ